MCVPVSTLEPTWTSIRETFPQVNNVDAHLLKFKGGFLSRNEIWTLMQPDPDSWKVTPVFLNPALLKIDKCVRFRGWNSDPNLQSIWSDRASKHDEKLKLCLALIDG